MNTLLHDNKLDMNTCGQELIEIKITDIEMNLKDRYDKIINMVLPILTDPKSHSIPLVELSATRGIRIEGRGFLLVYFERVAGEIEETIVPVQSKEVSSVGNTRFSMKVRPLEVTPEPTTQLADETKKRKVVEWQITVEFSDESRLSQDEKHNFIANVMKLV